MGNSIISELYSSMQGLLQIYPEYVYLIDYKFFPERMRIYLDIIKKSIKEDNTLDLAKYYAELKLNNFDLDISYEVTNFDDLYNQIKNFYYTEYLKLKIKRKVLPFLDKADYKTAIGNMFEILDKVDNTGSNRTINEIANNAKQLIDNYTNGISGLRTKFPTLDNYLKGIHGKQYLIIAGRPHMGKTTFALQVTYNFMIKNHKVLYFAFEQSSEMILSTLAGIHFQKPFYELEENEIDEFANEFRELLFIVDTNMTIYDIALEIKSMKTRHGVNIAFIDYIGLVKPHSNGKRHEIISEISKEIKRLTNAGSTIITLAQINRGVENLKDKRPTLAYLKESGSLEEDADKIILLHRPGYYNKNIDKNLMTVILAKNRGVGLTGELTTRKINNSILEVDTDYSAIMADNDLPF